MTSPGTPHQNGVEERGFATLYSWMHAMMVHMGIDKYLKTRLWPNCAATKTKIENIMVNPHE